MRNNKQSSVDLLFKNMFELTTTLIPEGKTRYELMVESYEQAKAMHKEEMIKNCAKMQIIDDVDFDGNVTFIFDPEKNYNETFGGNNEQQ